ncbi:hypothetical protein [uncultured Methanobrevibacter sp.]|uniref:hypothetical protein n=1 Tax=uncultured Methanobrevibacter sp. TaxID=253161 RepID=UPI0025E3F1EC|nr:hypothetical protein [uncultured Methanobrevibacter sp.]
MGENDIYIGEEKVGTVTDTIESIIQNELMHVYSTINDYFENIMNSPSTINRILPYYGYGVNIDDPNKRYIIFNGKIIREYILTFPKKDVNNWISKVMNK